MDGFATESLLYAADSAWSSLETACWYQFARNEQVFSSEARVRQQLVESGTEEALRAAVVIHLGSVEESDAGVQRLLDELLTLVCTLHPLEHPLLSVCVRHEAETDATHNGTSLTEAGVLHAGGRVDPGSLVVVGRRILSRGRLEEVSNNSWCMRLRHRSDRNVWSSGQRETERAVRLKR